MEDDFNDVLWSKWKLSEKPLSFNNEPFKTFTCNKLIN